MQHIRARRIVSKALQNIAWLSVDRVLRLTVGVFVGVWLARYLGPATFGQYSIAFALVALFGVFSKLGLDGLLVREFVRQPQAHGELLGTALMMRLIGGALGAGAATLCSMLLRPDDVTVQLLAAIASLGLVIQSFDVLDMWFQSRVSSRHVVVARSTAFLLLAAVKIALILLAASVTAFAIAAVAEMILASIGLIIVYRVSGGRVSQWRFSIARACALLRPAAPLIFAGMAVSAYMKIDQVMIAAILGDEAVGHYSAATRITEATYFVPSMIMASLLPAIISIKDASDVQFRDRMQRLFDLMVAIALLLAVPLSLLSNVVVPLLYGSAYQESAPVLAVHVWANVFVFLGIASSGYLLATNLTTVSLYRTALGAIANVVLNMAFIPAFGIVGAAWATLASAFIATFAVLLNARSRSAGLMMLRALVPLHRFARKMN